jgi:carbonic anhydrase
MCTACPTPLLRRRSALAATLALGCAAVQPARAGGARTDLTPQQALDALMAGNARHVAGLALARDTAARRAGLATGQAPFAAVLGCADSRVPPELAFDQGLGDLFVVRVAGNLVTREGLGSLEYGVAELGTPLILVLGHSGCGAVGATLAALRGAAPPPGQIGALVEAIAPGIAPVLHDADAEARAVAANVRRAVATLEAASPILAGLAAQGRLRLAGGVYALGSGRVTLV